METTPPTIVKNCQRRDAFNREKNKQAFVLLKSSQREASLKNKNPPKEQAKTSGKHRNWKKKAIYHAKRKEKRSKTVGQLSVDSQKQLLNENNSLEKETSILQVEQSLWDDSYESRNEKEQAEFGKELSMDSHEDKDMVAEANLGNHLDSNLEMDMIMEDMNSDKVKRASTANGSSEKVPKFPIEARRSFPEDKIDENSVNIRENEDKLSAYGDDELSEHFTLDGSLDMYSCEYCQTQFHSPIGIWKHAGAHKSDMTTEANWLCNICQSTHYSFYSLLLHIKSYHDTKFTSTNHRKIENLPFGASNKAKKCIRCNLSFLDADAFMMHFQTSHPEALKEKHPSHFQPSVTSTPVFRRSSNRDLPSTSQGTHKPTSAKK